MAKSNNQKAKILFLERMLRETGENRVVSMQEILDMLSGHGISAERKSIYDDLDALRSFGMDIRFHRGRPGGYYLAGQTVTVPDKVQKMPSEAQEEREESERKEQPVKAEKRKAPSYGGCVLSFAGLAKAGEKKRMLLFCEKKREADVRAYFGGLAEITSEDPGLLVVEAPVSQDFRFFGWVAAMSGDVHLRKPKRLAAAYRDYLKTLAKEYKGIGKKEE